ncbi:unnamed protein product, partial [Choristocarpus tenellus]
TGLLAHNSRARLWFRVASTRPVAEEVDAVWRESARQGPGIPYPRTLLALAVLQLANVGKSITSAALAHEVAVVTEGDVGLRGK